MSSSSESDVDVDAPLDELDLESLEKIEATLKCSLCTWAGPFTALIIHLADEHMEFQNRDLMNCFKCMIGSFIALLRSKKRRCLQVSTVREQISQPLCVLRPSLL